MRRGLSQSYVHHRNLLLRGYTEFSLATSLWNTSVLLWLLLTSIGIPKRMSIIVIPSIMLIVVTGIWLYGRWLYKKRMFERDQEWFAQRNPIFQEMLEILRELKNK